MGRRFFFDLAGLKGERRQFAEYWEWRDVHGHFDYRAGHPLQCFKQVTRFAQPTR
ncbi:hypothetical protein [Desertibaculum subflavum]|uniref:hypothetical protein n=1 Tax=Desertibaculum subflavum TaxID=2268458 RepID=UPI0013C3EA1E